MQINLNTAAAPFSSILQCLLPYRPLQHAISFSIAVPSTSPSLSLFLTSPVSITDSLTLCHTAHLAPSGYFGGNSNFSFCWLNNFQFGNLIVKRFQSNMTRLWYLGSKKDVIGSSLFLPPNHKIGKLASLGDHHHKVAILVPDDLPNFGEKIFLF